MHKCDDLKKLVNKEILYSGREYRRVKKVKKILNFIFEMFMKYKYLHLKFVTITFKDFESFLEFYRKKVFRFFYRNVFYYFWVVEYQERGVPHYHLLVLTKKKLRFFDDVYSFGYSNIKDIKRGDFHKVKNYVMKYLLKNKNIKKFEFQKLLYKLKTSKLLKLKLKTFSYKLKLLGKKVIFDFSYFYRKMKELFDVRFEIERTGFGIIIKSVKVLNIDVYEFKDKDIEEIERIWGKEYERIREKCLIGF